MAIVLDPPIIADKLDEPISVGLSRAVLRLPLGVITSEQFFEISQLNDLLRLEREANGDIVIMPPTVGSTGRRNSKISYQLEHWASQTRGGVTLDSSGGYELPNGLVLSPDASWFPQEWWDALTEEQKDRFPPFFPVFAIELVSPSDRLPTVRKKMRTYLDNGTLLAWLIIPTKSQVEVYEAGKEPVVHEKPSSISADPILPGFVLDLTEIWK